MSLKDKLVSGLYFGGAVLASILSKCSDVPYKEVISAYGHDVTLPFGLYFYNKLSSRSQEEDWIKASVLFLGCSAFEVAQRLGLYGGTYDPKDFAAYAVGAGLAVAVDRLTFRKKNLSRLVNEFI